jgi:hypothetical protein
MAVALKDTVPAFEGVQKAQEAFDWKSLGIFITSSIIIIILARNPDLIGDALTYILQDATNMVCDVTLTKVKKYFRDIVEDNSNNPEKYQRFFRALQVAQEIVDRCKRNTT